MRIFSRRFVVVAVLGAVLIQTVTFATQFRSSGWVEIALEAHFDRIHERLGDFQGELPPVVMSQSMAADLGPDCVRTIRATMEAHGREFHVGTDDREEPRFALYRGDITPWFRKVVVVWNDNSSCGTCAGMDSVSMVFLGRWTPIPYEWTDAAAHVGDHAEIVGERVWQQISGWIDQVAR